MKPLDYRLHVNDDGSTTTVESRIKVLTSQLEDMFFRLCIRGVDAQTGELLPGLDVLTGALKVSECSSLAVHRWHCVAFGALPLVIFNGVSFCVVFSRR